MRDFKQGSEGGPIRRLATLAVCYDDVANRRCWQQKSSEVIKMSVSNKVKIASPNLHKQHMTLKSLLNVGFYVYD